MKNYGYIKLDRNITDWAWSKDAITFFVFINLILMANYSEKPFGDTVIKRGQLVIGRKKLAEKTEFIRTEHKNRFKSPDKNQRHNHTGTLKIHDYYYK